MFYYFGSKERLSKLYSEPRHTQIIEPFAGSAGYARRHWQHEVLLIERDPRVVTLWERLRRMSVDEALSLPAPEVGTRSSELLVMLRAASEHSLTGTYITVTPRMVSRWDNLRRRIAEYIPQVQHWEIRQGDYRDAPDVTATWFVDPPYQGLTRGYAFRDLDYTDLAVWCRKRSGQVIVCEQGNACWLPFRPLTEHRGMTNQKRMELVWEGGDPTS